MNTKVGKWGAKQHRLQVYLPANVQEAMDRYIADKYSPSTRIITAIVTRAVSEFLESEGYLDRKEVKDEVKTA